MIPRSTLGARLTNASRAPSSRASRGTTTEIRPVFAGGVGLLGACSHFSNTLLVRAGWILLAALPLAVEIAAEAGQGATPAAQSSEYFESSVRPVLAASCYECHGDSQMAGLRLDSRDGLLKGGRS